MPKTLELRSWIWTLNNYTDAEVKELLGGDIGDLRFLCFGKEVGEQGTPHLQGYAEFHKPISVIGLKKRLGPKLHLEGRRGTQTEAVLYCSKESVLYRRGTPARETQGARMDLVEIREALKQGLPIRELLACDKMCNTQALKFAEASAKYLEPGRTWKPEVRWFYGPPGSGKTRAARAWLSHAFTKNSGSGKWWDGYDAHEEVLLDDFRDSHCPLTDLLGLLDRYEYRVEIKGGMRQMMAKKIAITSVQPPAKMYAHAKGEPIEQLARRIDHIVLVDPQMFDDPQKLG